MPKVSVIVPVYNVEKYLARCLDSLVAQTLEDIEIICVNDGSTDNSADILAKYAEKDDRITVITQSNAGLSNARNAGIDIATGDYIGFLDSDDFIEKDFYEKLYNSVTQHNADVACASIIRENEKKRKELIKYDNVVVKSGISEKFALVKAPEHCYVWNKIYKTNVLKEKEIRFIGGLIYEDMPFTADVLTKMGSVVCVPNTKYHYWVHNESLIKDASDKPRADKIFSKKYITKICHNYGIRLRERDNLVCKKEYYFFGIKLLKVYVYRATKKYYLFGLLPLIICKEYV